MFEVTPEALNMIKELEAGRTRPSQRITICSSGVGCGGPALKVEMRDQLEDDIEETVNGQIFHIRAAIHNFLEGSVIEAADSFWGKRLYVRTTYKCV